MRRLSVCCFTGQTTKNDRKRSEFLQGSNKNTEISRMDNGNGNTEAVVNEITIASSQPPINIIKNHDFSHGMESWHPNSCDAFVASPEIVSSHAMSETSKSAYAVVTNRKETWQGLEQDITDRVFPNSVYKVTAWVGISGPVQDLTEVLATMKLEQHSETKFLFIAKTCASKEKWEKLEGTFSLSSVPDRIVFFLEGPKPGIDLLVQSVTIQHESSHESEAVSPPPAINIITNHDFSDGLQSWHPNSCEAFVVSPGSSNSHMFQETSKCSYAVVTNRKETWQGLEQDITNQVSRGSVYKVSACVGVSGPDCGSTEVLATLKLEHGNSATQYQAIAKTCISKGKWENLEGQFSLSSMPDRVVFYLEGPAPGVDLLIHSVTIHCEHKSTQELCVAAGDESIILNPTFEDGLKNWSGRSCKVVLHDSMADGKIVPQSGKAFASATERTQTWNGIQQEITGRVERKRAYEATAIVRIFGNNVTNATVQSTLWVQVPNRRDQYIGIANVQATDKDWVQLKGKFLLNASPSRVVIYIEGPPAGTDILVNSFAVKHAEKLPPPSPPPMENPAFGVNIVANSQLSDGTTAGWFPLGNCNLSVGEGSPHILPPMARDSLGPHGPLNGRCILTTNRTQTWMGPAQIITDKVKLFLTYQVSAWVKIGSFATATSNGPQNVNVALGVDSQWVNGGQVEIKDDRWHEIAGSFRIEQNPAKVMVYIQGPSPGVDLMVAGLQIFPVDRQARIKYLRKQADKLRKRDVVLKFSGADSGKMSVRVRQTHNSFPLGTCISRTNIDNEDFVDFFVKNFNWAVFGNELKWYWTEPQQGNFNYQDADDLVDLCRSNNIELRGHCIFWEVQDTVQQWIQNLSKSDLNAAVQNRLTGLLNRYKGKFRHYDVNNEMLHGSFYRDRLGDDVRTSMFKTAHQLDPSAALFVNDYHVEDGCDTRSCPEKYIEQILDLQEKGATVGGIGVQGHIDTPVGPIVSASLDKLGILGLPVWFTELDVSSTNEHVRADDLETILWEAFAHPAVEGIMLWGFWELFMSRENSHLVNAEGDLNEAGKRFLSVKRGWLSHADGRPDEKGAFAFRGFQGTYTVEIANATTPGAKKILKAFTVDKGDLPLEINIDL